MSYMRLDDCPEGKSAGFSSGAGRAAGAAASSHHSEPSTPWTPGTIPAAGPRRTPRRSVIVVLPDDHILSAERLAQRLPVGCDHEVDIIVACAGQPADLGSLHRTARGAQFLLAPAGTTEEELRELAMAQAPGDIVTLLSGALLRSMPSAERELLQSS